MTQVTSRAHGSKTDSISKSSPRSIPIQGPLLESPPLIPNIALLTNESLATQDDERRFKNDARPSPNRDASHAAHSNSARKDFEAAVIV